MAHSIGYRGRKHQDWFDENSDTITTSLDYMHKAHRATLNSPISVTLRQQWCASHKEIYADKDNMLNFYNLAKIIFGPRSRSITPLKTADGLTLLKDKNQILLG